jgi:hypothetical protein
MLDPTLTVIEDFAAELEANHSPPSIPFELEKSARGWSMRLNTIRDKVENISGAERLQVCSRLAAVLSIFDAYISDWDQRLEEMDPYLIDYEFMPGDFSAVDTVRILAERVNLALYDVIAIHFDLEEETDEESHHPAMQMMKSVSNFVRPLWSSRVMSVFKKVVGYAILLLIFFGSQFALAHLLVSMFPNFWAHSVFVSYPLLMLYMLSWPGLMIILGRSSTLNKAFSWLMDEEKADA